MNEYTVANLFKYSSQIKVPLFICDKDLTLDYDTELLYGNNRIYIFYCFNPTYVFEEVEPFYELLGQITQLESKAGLIHNIVSVRGLG